MDVETAARRLEAIGHETRLRMFLALSEAGAAGLAVGALQAEVGIPASSTLSHHLRRLVNAGLVTQRRTGTTLICHAEEAALDAVLRMLGERRTPVAASSLGADRDPSTMAARETC